MSNTPAPQAPNPAALTAPGPAPVQMPLKICIQPTAGEVITSLRTGVPPASQPKTSPCL